MIKNNIYQYLDFDFNVLSYGDINIECEDPRIFIHNNIIFILDNLFNYSRIYNTFTKKYIYIKLEGKNFTFISHNNKLYIIHYMKPFSLYEVNANNGSVKKVDVNNNYLPNLEYRGGTPGYKTNIKGVYYGMGHKTYKKDELYHDIFIWLIDFRKKNPELIIKDIEKPEITKKISDPTSIILINNEYYLITAESEYPWSKEQDYITSIYLLQTDKLIIS